MQYIIKFNKQIKLLFVSLIFSNFIFANTEHKACIDKEACPRIIELSKLSNLKSVKISDNKKNLVVTNRIRITNKSKRDVTTKIVATLSNGARVDCAQFSLARLSSIESDLNCNVSGTSYTLGDGDGRSNLLAFTTPNLPSRTFYWAFITSDSFNGAFKNTFDANQKCKDLADASSLSEVNSRQWKAWLSDSTNNAIDNIYDGSVDNTLPYRTPASGNSAGTLIFNSLNELIACPNDGSNCIQNKFQTENGIDPGSTGAWTGTLTNGTSSGINCNDWTAATGRPTPSGTSGISTTLTNGSWTETSSVTCGQVGRLYCFEVES